MLAGRRVVLGVTGGIAAYKAIDVCRRLVDAGAHVSPILTPDSLRFVGKVTFDALGSEKAQTSLWDEADPIPHTRLGQKADVVVVAPATARLLAAYAAGLSDDLLTATLLATRAPVIVCPAMHTEMWEHPAVQHNLQVLAERGVTVVPPEEGRLAGGDVGAGRLADPDVIVEAVRRALVEPDMAGLSVLVTAGGTREPIDPVRYITNRSSGRQGHAVADEAAARGAKVVLVTAAPTLGAAAGVEVVRVDTAAQMADAVLTRASQADVVVMAAAVADFRPSVVAPAKIKKSAGVPELQLEPTNDILAAVVAARPPDQTVVGFAAETDDVVANARVKLEAKGADLVVVNDVTEAGAGFDHLTNHVVIVGRHVEIDVPLGDKRAVAGAVLDAVKAHRVECTGAP